MAFRRSIFVLAVTILAAVAQEVPKADAPPPKADRPPGDGPRREGRHRPPWMKDVPDEKAIRERMDKELEKLTPEQRGEFWRTVWAVNFMPKEEKVKIIGESDERRKAMREEVDRVFREIGLTPEDPRRREFFFRYFGGRKEIEAQLLKETDERRKALLKELEGKLKVEFAKPAPEKAPPAPPK